MFDTLNLTESESLVAVLNAEASVVCVCMCVCVFVCVFVCVCVVYQGVGHVDRRGCFWVGLGRQFPAHQNCVSGVLAHPPTTDCPTFHNPLHRQSSLHVCMQ